MTVFVLDKRKRPLMPCSNKRAHQLLDRGRARVHRLYPFTIRLVDRYVEDSVLQDLTIKVDPGSKGTGVALVREDEVITPHGEIFRNVHIVFLMELWHRSLQIHLAMQDRSGHRRKRRNGLRYREPRFNNRTKPAGWLPPSIRHRVIGIINWTKRLKRIAPITKATLELVSFDTRKLKDPNVKGNQYQRGPLHAKTLRQYLLTKHKGKCFYCNTATGPMEIEHITPRAKGGITAINNLVLACRQCNIAKGTQSITDVLKGKPDLLASLKDSYNTTYRDAAAVNASQAMLLQELRQLGLDVETADGANTYENRVRLGLPKTHCIDAACVGFVSNVINAHKQSIMSVWSMGRGRYQRTLLYRNGFPRAYIPRVKRHYGFQTGDICQAIVTTGKKIGAYTGRIAVRSRGYFDIRTKTGLITDISHRFFRIIQRADGYQYQFTQIT